MKLLCHPHQALFLDKTFSTFDSIEDYCRPRKTTTSTSRASTSAWSRRVLLTTICYCYCLILASAVGWPQTAQAFATGPTTNRFKIVTHRFPSSLFARVRPSPCCTRTSSQLHCYNTPRRAGSGCASSLGSWSSSSRGLGLLRGGSNPSRPETAFRKFTRQTLATLGVGTQPPSSFALAMNPTSTSPEDLTSTTVPAHSSATKLQALRESMQQQGLHVYLVPTDDPHLSEYVPDAYKRREFLTGFKGSAGTAVVTAMTLPQVPSGPFSTTPSASAEAGDASVDPSVPGEEGPLALLWTDSRYWNEASLQLDATQWTLQKSGLPSTPSISKWLSDLAVRYYQLHRQPLTIGLDPFVHAASFCKEVETALTEAAQEMDLADEPHDPAQATNGSEGAGAHGSTATPAIEVVGVIKTLEQNLVDAIWGASRPAVPTSPFRVHPLEYAGMSVEAKVAQIRQEMQTKKVTLTVFSALDDVAYLLNVRAQGDIDTCPVGIAYATVSMDAITLYCDEGKLVSTAVQEHLAEVTVKPYDAIVSDIIAHCAEGGKKRVWLDKSRSNYALVSAIPEKCLLDAQNAITPMKACKNDAEMEGMRRAHIVDGAAMAHFMAWLENTVVNEGRSVSEVEVDERLTAYRAQQEGFLEVSFPTIAGVGSNGAIVHYRAQEGSPLLKYLDTNVPMLLDSGGQYAYGTTDVTRTWHFGEASAEFIDYYTRVLKGNIGVDQMIFPENTPGFVLDVFARRSLWDGGKDYGHGTGHGVGAALNVHEGPHSISPRWTNKEVLKKGMVVSNEPGYYEDGNFGIRIENLLEIRHVKPEDDTPEVQAEPTAAPKSNEKKFLKFEKLTMIPIQKNLINIEMMTNEELDWLDTYHAQVLDKVGPLLDAESPAMKWLKKSCEPIDRNGR